MNENRQPRSIEWIGGLEGVARVLDQTRLPAEVTWIDCQNAGTMREAIKRLSVRGAPAIGIAAAMGAVLGIRAYAGTDREGFLCELDRVSDDLASSRPTAINLVWALDRLRNLAHRHQDATVSELKELLLAEAKLIRDEDEAMCRAIGRHGEPLIKPKSSVLTHCNAGGLATAAYGTALAPMYSAHEKGRSFRVFADETRPLLQGARLTAWELGRAGIDVVLLCDGMVGALMQAGKVDLVITGADRIAANGDVANKIGTYGVAVLAEAHGVPFYVAAPSSTFDLSLRDGAAIPIEHRDPVEVRSIGDVPVAPPGVDCFNPAFDVTPARLIRGIITERGIIEPVGAEGITETITDERKTG